MQDTHGAQQWLTGSLVSVLRNHASQCTNGLVMSEVWSWTNQSLSGDFGRYKITACAYVSFKYDDKIFVDLL